MHNSSSIQKLCEICSELDVGSEIPFLQPCLKPLPCSTPPTLGADLGLGSVDEIKSRRPVCNLCGFVADSLDKEPSDLDGVCRLRQNAEFCNFTLPRSIKARDPSTTHYHLTQASVIFDTSEANRFQGPSLPWDLKARDNRSSHYILNLQAKAKSDLAASSQTTTIPQTEHEFLATIGGRYVSAQVNTQLVRAWLHQCESEHGEDCVPSLRLPVGKDKQPALVVDVTQSCLVDTPSRCRYVALSYVWGTAPVYTHLTEYTQDLPKIGSLHSLPIPSTIRDAITLVRAIGERYLWVDSLCIIQNDWKMKEVEIMRMGSIYSRALFTIIAAAGDNANSGLPGVEEGTREQAQQVLKVANCELLTVIDIRKTPNGIDDTTWAQRAWTFQERVLSSRVLVFSTNQVYWNCRVASHSEERALDGVQDLDRHHLSFPQKFATDFLSWYPLRPFDYCNLYDDLLSNYRQRRLTYQTDLLNAFNGVSEILASLQDDKFLWGLPESLFSYAMTWSFTGHSARNCVCIPFKSGDLKEMVPIPSWSWAAWSGENPENIFLHGGYSTHVRPVIQFSIVDRKRQLVKVAERSWSGDPSDRAHALRPGNDIGEEPYQFQPPTNHSVLLPGQLHFWTSLANVKAVRRWRVQGPGALEYELFPAPDFKPDPNSSHYRSEIVYQDFVVIATDGPKKLVLLAIEWKDGVAFRVGSTVVEEAAWVRASNRQWRLITLG